ncbi:MAG TPA: DNA translocase FtsK, partial [Bacillus bacterium]|nr:DNA translocase FtsK [Bacillus sp. (in: firmicutes)]
ISDEETEANETASTAEMISGEETEANELASRAEMISNEETEANEPTKEEPTIDEEVKENNQRPTRSHLPFNVLMLSQDRTRWQKQKERQKDKGENVLSATKVTDETEKSSSETVHYELPGLELLKPPVFKEENTEWLNEQTTLLDETMENFNVKARVVNASQGPSVTRFEVQPDKGVKVNKITNLSNDIKLSMAARDIRMEAPIPGTRSIGIELPNKESRPVQISEIIGKTAFSKAESPLTAVLGLDISGEPVVTDLRKMPHGLIAGATGSGKSVCINSILVSLLYKARPDELKLMLIDPKMVELAPYNHIPHLVSPVITDVKAATAALKWAVDEMERRYELFVHAGVRDIGRFNELAKTKGQKSEHLPYIVIIIDELADLMMVAPAEVEESICRIAQKARACGIHLLIATQRPSVDVITGLIKANVPTRIAFAVSSQVDSRTVIDVSGAEKLLGRGDMLFLNNGSVKPVRLQGTFVSDEEIDQVIEHVRNQGKPNYLFQQEELLKKAEIQENEDELLMDACEFVVKQGNASTSLLQRQFRIGYNRAARLMEMMEDQGVISGANGSKPRDVLIKEAELDLLKDSLVH